MACRYLPLRDSRVAEAMAWLSSRLFFDFRDLTSKIHVNSCQKVKVKRKKAAKKSELPAIFEFGCRFLHFKKKAVARRSVHLALDSVHGCWSNSLRLLRSADSAPQVLSAHRYF